VRIQQIAKDLWTLSNVLPPELCAALIVAGKECGFMPARDFATYGRHNSEAFIKNPAIHAQLLGSNGALSRFIGRERLPFIEVYRYQVGDSVAAHTDRRCEIEPGIISVATLVIYLNDSFGAGRTIFPDLSMAISPAPGAGVVFSHGIRHSGEVVTSGTKYICRMDLPKVPVVTRPGPKLVTRPKLRQNARNVEG